MTLSSVRQPARVTPDVSVVICAYSLDRWSDLQRAVGSVLAQKQPVQEVIVVVDHNLELLARAAACWNSRKCAGHRSGAARVVENAGARGLSGARNTGVGVARCEIVAFLDDDAVAEADWTERLLVHYADPKVVACGGAALPVLMGPRPDWWPLEFDWVVGCSFLGLPTSTAPIRNLIGANMSARRDAILEVEGFAEDIGRIGVSPVGDEETLLGIRLVQHRPDALILYEPAARIGHTVRPERLSWSYFRARCFAEGMSKARVAGRVGRDRALASERSYTLKVLPRGMAKGLLDACRGRKGAVRRALAIAAGLAVTTAGYLRGRIALVASPEAASKTSHLDVIARAPPRRPPRHRRLSTGDGRGIG